MFKKLSKIFKFIKYKNIILDTFFPRFCLNCQKEGDWICSNCLATIDILEYEYCPFCMQRVSEQDICIKHQNKNLDKLFFAVSYKNLLIKKAIKKFKYPPFLRELTPYFCYLIISHFLLTKNKTILENNALLIPVPISSFKKRWRGYNQSEEIAQQLSTSLKVPILINNLIKIKKTKSQSSLSKLERMENIKNVFKIKNALEIQGKEIFLVDDVFTTGATMEECARVLKNAGAKNVFGVAIAREEIN